MTRITEAPVSYYNLLYDTKRAAELVKSSVDKNPAMNRFVETSVAIAMLEFRDLAKIKNDTLLTNAEQRVNVGRVVRRLIHRSYTARIDFLRQYLDMYGVEGATHPRYPEFSPMVWNRAAVRSVTMSSHSSALVKGTVLRWELDHENGLSLIILDAVSASLSYHLYNKYPEGMTESEQLECAAGVNIVIQNNHAMSTIAYHMIADGPQSPTATLVWDWVLGGSSVMLSSMFARVFIDSKTIQVVQGPEAHLVLSSRAKYSVLHLSQRILASCLSTRS